MKSVSKPLSLLIALFSTVSVAQAWDPNNLVLPTENSPFHGNCSRTTGIVNITHFAHETDPLGSGSNKEKRRLATATFPDGEHLTLTIPARVGATFSGSPSLEAVIDGMNYQVQGSFNLTNWSETVTEITPAQSAGLPPLSDIDGDSNPDWEYRTFTLENDPLSGGFIRVGVEEAPVP